MKNPKIAVIGCGYWGQNLVRKFAELGALAALCDASKEQAKKIASLYGNPPLMTMEDIAQSKEIDGVVIASPAALHAAHVTQFLTAGKHVFVEKPLALSLDDAQKLQQLSEQKKCILMIGHLLQYHPAYLKLKALIQNNTLGTLKYIYSNRLNVGKIRAEENVLWSFAPHDISMILGLVSSPIERISATGAYCINDTISDFATVNITFKKSIQAHLFVSWLNPFKEQKLIVVGDKGMAVFDDTQEWSQKLQIYPHEITQQEGFSIIKKVEATPIALNPDEPLKKECEHFLECIKKGTSPITNAAEAIRVLEVLSMAQESMDQHRLLKTEENTEPYFKHESAYIDEGAKIGAGSKIWHFSHILKGVEIGQNTIIGQNVMIGPDVKIGHNCKIQNNVSLYKGVTLEEGVFCGPSCVFTNVNTPRAEIERKNEYLKTYVEKSVTIGANATIVCGVKLGAFSFIGAGAVVTKDVVPHALVVGTPARQIGWVSHSGERLDKNFVCPREGRQYQVIDNQLVEMKEIRSKNHAA